MNADRRRSTRTTLRHVDSGEELPTVFSYSDAEPFAVTMTFLRPQRVWLFSRDLLIAAVEGDRTQPEITRWSMVGEADVRLQRVNTAELWIWLTSPSGTASFIAPALDVATFLIKAKHLVWPGTELDSYDMDAVLAGWLEQDAA